MATVQCRHATRPHVIIMMVCSSQISNQFKDKIFLFVGLVDVIEVADQIHTKPQDDKKILPHQFEKTVDVAINFRACSHIAQ